MKRIATFAFALAALAGFAASAQEAQLDGCAYTIAATQVYPPFPPVWVVAVEGCGQRVEIGTSYRAPVLDLIAAGNRRLVASYTHADTPSGEAHWKLGVVGLSAELEIEQYATIGAMSPSMMQPQLGNVTSGALTWMGGLLFVRGAYDGIIPDAIELPGATGGRFLAVFAGFFGPPPPTAPLSIWSY